MLLSFLPILAVAAWASECPPSPEAAVAGYAADLICQAGEFCQPSGRRRLWAQEAMATDLAQDWLRDNRIPRATRIAVVDTGFATSLAEQMAGPPVVVKAASPSQLGAAKQDPLRHGTRVVSEIKGAGGIGMSVDSTVTVYALGAATPRIAPLVAAIDRACRDGNSVINVSFEEISSRDATRPLSRLAGPPYALRWEKMGCVLVHSAGNHRQERRAYLSEPGENEIEVAAAAPISGRAHFSADAAVYVPGQDVIGIDGLRPARHADACENALGTFSSGTSFGAPASASVASQVRDVLVAGGSSLTQENLGRAVVAIVAKSRRFGLANALMAVRMAAELKRNPSLGVGFVADALARAVEKDSLDHGLCRSMPAECALASQACEIEQKCLNGLRRAALLCPVDETTEELRRTLVDRLERVGDLEWASSVAATLAPVPGSSQLKFDFSGLQQSLAAQGSGLDRWMEYLAKRQTREQVPVAPEFLDQINRVARTRIDAATASKRAKDYDQWEEAQALAGRLPAARPEAVEEFLATISRAETPRARRLIYAGGLARADVAAGLTHAQLSRAVRALSNPRDDEQAILAAQIVGRSTVAFDRFKAAVGELLREPDLPPEALAALAERLESEKDAGRFEVASQLIRSRPANLALVTTVESRLRHSLPPDVEDAVGEADVQLTNEDREAVRLFLAFEREAKRRYPTRERPFADDASEFLKLLNE
jgi:hypothetical protein